MINFIMWNTIYCSTNPRWMNHDIVNEKGSFYPFLKIVGIKIWLKITYGWNLKIVKLGEKLQFGRINSFNWDHSIIHAFLIYWDIESTHPITQTWITRKIWDMAKGHPKVIRTDKWSPIDH